MGCLLYLPPIDSSKVEGLEGEEMKTEPQQYGKIEFFKNGVLEALLQNVPDGVTYYPAVSLFSSASQAEPAQVSNCLASRHCL